MWQSKFGPDPFKKQCPDAAALRVGLSLRVQDQISTPNHVFVFCYSYLKRSEFLFTTSRVAKNKWVLVYKFV